MNKLDQEESEIPEAFESGKIKRSKDPFSASNLFPGDDLRSSNDSVALRTSNL